MILKPVDGTKVPDPFRGGFLPSEGRECGDPLDQYWLRRLADSEVEQVTHEPKSSKKGETK